MKFNVGSTETLGRVTSVELIDNHSFMRVILNNPICTSLGEKVAFCRNIGNKFRLIGWGDITKGEKVNIV